MAPAARSRYLDIAEGDRKSRCGIAAVAAVERRGGRPRRRARLVRTGICRAQRFAGSPQQSCRGRRALPADNGSRHRPVVGGRPFAACPPCCRRRPGSREGVDRLAGRLGALGGLHQRFCSRPRPGDRRLAQCVLGLSCNRGEIVRCQTDRSEARDRRVDPQPRGFGRQDPPPRPFAATPAQRDGASRLRDWRKQG